MATSHRVATLSPPVRWLVGRVKFMLSEDGPAGLVKFMLSEDGPVGLAELMLNMVEQGVVAGSRR